MNYSVKNVLENVFSFRVKTASYNLASSRCNKGKIILESNSVPGDYMDIFIWNTNNLPLPSGIFFHFPIYSTTLECDIWRAVIRMGEMMMYVAFEEEILTIAA